MSSGKQKYFSLICEDDSTIFCIMKSMSVNGSDDIILTIQLSENWLKNRNINISENIQIMNFQLFGKEITGFEGTEQEWLNEVSNNFKDKYKEFINVKAQMTLNYGLDKFYFKTGETYNDFETKLQDHCDLYGFILTKQNTH